MTPAELLAQKITESILKQDAGAGKTIGDLTENDKSGYIYNSWLNICKPLVQYLGASGSVSGFILWGSILGSISDQTDLYEILTTLQNVDNNLQNQITLVSGSLVTEIQNRINADNNLQSQINQLVISGGISTGENLGSGEGIYIGNFGSILRFKTLKGSGSINVSTIGNEIIIDGQDLQSQITLVSGSLTTEIQNRTNVDNNLQNQITLVSGSLVTEIQDRVNADNNLQNQITLVSGSLVTEIQNRINADNNLQNQITLVSGSLVTEIQNRINADNNLQNQIDQLVISGSISTGENLGNGEGIYIGNSGSILQFKTLKGSGSINVSTVNDEVIIDGQNLQNQIALVSGSLADLLSNASPGDILYRGISTWQKLPKGVDGQILVLVSGLPSWGNVSWENASKSKSFNLFNLGSIRSWTMLAPTPGTIYYGGALVYTGGDYIYALRGSGSADFYRYSISENSWTTMTATPNTIGYGSALVYTGGDYIYALRGWGYTNFYRYSISGNSWTTMALTPNTIGGGGSLVYTGEDYIYALRGSGSVDFYRYSISGNSWTTMTLTPNSIGGGGSLVYTGGDYIYALRGYGFTDFYRYSISGNGWTVIASTPGTINHGGSLVYTGGDYIYALRGYGFTDFYRINGNIFDWQHWMR